MHAKCRGRWVTRQVAYELLNVSGQEHPLEIGKSSGADFPRCASTSCRHWLGGASRQNPIFQSAPRTNGLFEAGLCRARVQHTAVVLPSLWSSFSSSLGRAVPSTSCFSCGSASTRSAGGHPTGALVLCSLASTMLLAGQNLLLVDTEARLLVVSTHSDIPAGVIPFHVSTQHQQTLLQLQPSLQTTEPRPFAFPTVASLDPMTHKPT